jgi:hypothetical protein
VEQSVAVVLLGIGVFFLELARRSRLGLVAPQSGLGWRAKAALRSDAAWYAAQRAAVPYNVVGGIVAVAGAVCTLAIGLAALGPTGGALGIIGLVAAPAVTRAATRAYDEFAEFE